MARKDRISMDTQAQIAELIKKGHSVRKIAQILKMCRRTIRKYVKRLEEIEKEKQFQSNQLQDQKHSGDKIQIQNEQEIIRQFPVWLQSLDWKQLLHERQKGVSYKVLYIESDLKEVKYWNFWHALKRLEGRVFKPKIETTMRLRHNPGEKVFVDYGDGINIVDPATGEVTKTWIFVATLPFSSKVYAEFAFSQKLGSFIQSHERMWNFFGGVAKYVVCDNLKSAVTQARLYDPDVNKTFVSYANHAGFAVLPARPRRPKDKANVESHVGILQRSFFQLVRHKTFSTIGQLNHELDLFLKDFNNNVMKDYGVSRNERFSEEEKHLQELPLEEFLIPEVKEATVHPDCHIQYGKSFYSVPWQYVGKKVRVIATTNRVQIFDLLTLERIALHSRSRKLGERKTEELHWPPEKREHCDFTIEIAKKEAAKVGNNTSKLVNYLFNLPHPLIYLRRVQGWIRIVSSGKCTRQAMEYAASMALQHQKFNSAYVNDCAKYFDKAGLIEVKKSNAPQRNAEYIYLQN